MGVAEVSIRLAELPAKRTRASRPKVKTGCTTCKIRRIKCDESKPHCTRCASTGRTCDGYIILSDDKQSTSSEDTDLSVATIPSAAWNPLLDYTGTPLEHRYLVYFKQQTAPILSGYFDSHFWNGLLLQVGYSEPTIQHAMMAVASIHEQVEIAGAELLNPGQRDFGMNYGRSFALQQYNKAIVCLKERLSRGCQSEEITLMCCLLFICLEFLRGNIDIAISHMKSGLGIMAAWRVKDRRLLPDEALPITLEPQSVPDNLEQIFSRLSIQAMLCGQDPPQGKPILTACNMSEMIPATFSNLQAARASLDFLMKTALQFLRQLHKLPIGSKAHPGSQLDLMRELEKMINAFDTWSLAFDLYLARSIDTRKARDIRAATNLRMLLIIAKIWLASAVTNQESIFDQEIQAFSTVVNLAATIILSDVTANRISKSKSVSGIPADDLHTFTFEMGFIPPLYFVAMKCRVPSIRRTAITLLSATMPRREGVWIADVYIAVAKRVIELEEEDLASVGCKDEATGEMLPPEWKRLQDVIILSRAEEYLAERLQRVTFLARPDGPGGPFREITETIRW